MKKLNLELGQKVWSIQLGDCVVVDNNIDNEFPIMCKSLINDNKSFYTRNGKFSYDSEDFYPSLFESNPFEPVLVQENKDGWIESKENKAEMINALFNVANVDWDTKGGLVKTARVKLQKLLESL